MLTCVTAVGVKNVRLLNLPGTSTPVVMELGCRLRSGVREQDVPPAGSEHGGQAAALSPVLGASFPCRGAGSCCGRWTDGSLRSCSGAARASGGTAAGLFLFHLGTWSLSILGQVARPREQSARAVRGLGQRSALLLGGRGLGQAPSAHSRLRGCGRRGQSCPHCQPDANCMRRGPVSPRPPSGPRGVPSRPAQAVTQERPGYVLGRPAAWHQRHWQPTYG